MSLMLYYHFSSKQWARHLAWWLRYHMGHLHLIQVIESESRLCSQFQLTADKDFGSSGCVPATHNREPRLSSWLSISDWVIQQMVALSYSVSASQINKFSFIFIKQEAILTDSVTLALKNGNHIVRLEDKD